MRSITAESVVAASKNLYPVGQVKVLNTLRLTYISDTLSQSMFEDTKMIDAKQAVKKAVTYLNDMFDAAEFKDVFPEEVELTDDDRFWDVTIGFLHRQVSISEGPMASLVGPTEGFKREVRVFRIDAETGTIRSMKSKKGD